uniref:Protein kinase domain-containing protein n=1 Tax=Kalanchoe fedtschenkoi TaxID=63787 RepID=A0A7N0ZWM4_KALFE
MRKKAMSEPSENPGQVGDYLVMEKVSQGRESTVWKAKHAGSGQVVALKQIHLSKLNSHLRDCLHCELNFLSSVRHPNIVRLIDAIHCEDSIFLALEYCAEGNLAMYLQKHGRVQDETARSFLKQLGDGLQILHSKHIIHRDLKPENILLSSSESGLVLKIADFGLSRVMDPNGYAETVCGSPSYMAPEVLQFQRYNERVDMWSTGVILFELVNGYRPFNGRNNVQLLQNIKSCNSLPFSPQILPGLHQDCLDLCYGLLSRDPRLRLSFDEFYSHLYLRRIPRLM